MHPQPVRSDKAKVIANLKPGNFIFCSTRSPTEAKPIGALALKSWTPANLKMTMRTFRILTHLVVRMENIPENLDCYCNTLGATSLSRTPWCLIERPSQRPRSRLLTRSSSKSSVLIASRQCAASINFAATPKLSTQAFNPPAESLQHTPPVDVTVSNSS